MATFSQTMKGNSLSDEEIVDMAIKYVASHNNIDNIHSISHYTCENYTRGIFRKKGFRIFASGCIYYSNNQNTDHYHITLTIDEKGDFLDLELKISDSPQNLTNFCVYKKDSKEIKALNMEIKLTK